MNNKGYSRAKVDISNEIQSTHIEDYWGDNYNVTVNHLFNKMNRKLNKLLGL